MTAGKTADVCRFGTASTTATGTDPELVPSMGANCWRSNLSAWARGDFGEFYKVHQHTGSGMTLTFVHSCTKVDFRKIWRESKTKAKENQATHTNDGYQLLQNSAKAVNTRDEIAKVAGVSRENIRKAENINIPQIFAECSSGTLWRRCAEICTSSAFGEFSKGCQHARHGRGARFGTLPNLAESAQDAGTDGRGLTRWRDDGAGATLPFHVLPTGAGMQIYRRKYRQYNRAASGRKCADSL